MAELKPEQKVEFQPKNLICNFRAPDVEHYEVWQRFKKWCKDNGLDVCNVALDQIQAFMKAVDSSSPGVSSPKPLVTTKGQVIIIQQQNSFVYSVDKPRREPIFASCAKPAFARTISGLASEAYVMEKARDLKGSFSMRDFLEIEHDSFRKIVLRLRKKGKIVALPLRTNPRMFVLTERLAEYGLERRTLQ